VSRIGKMPIPIPKGVEVRIESGKVLVKGPKGQLSSALPDGVSAATEGGQLLIRRASEDPSHRALHGLVRSLVANSVEGVTRGFKRELDVVGVGYRAEVKGKTVVFSLGYSHPVNFPVPEGISIEIDAKTNHIVVSGADKQKVGQTAAEIRKLRVPDPYKAKGIKYSDETIRRKVGKAGGK
jgi:large subunit ribosomal protein L6